MTDQQFAPGFRCSVFDVAVLAVGAVGSIFAWQHTAWWAGVGVAFIVLHFFLFCNVFRIRRVPELIWASIFSALGATTIQTGFPGLVRHVRWKCDSHCCSDRNRDANTRIPRHFLEADESEPSPLVGRTTVR